MIYIEIYLQYIVYINTAFSLFTWLCVIYLPPLSIIVDHMLTHFWPMVPFVLVYFRWWMSTNQNEYIIACTFKNHDIIRKYNASPVKLFYFNCNIFWKNKIMVYCDKQNLHPLVDHTIYFFTFVFPSRSLEIHWSRVDR